MVRGEERRDDEPAEEETKRSEETRNDLVGENRGRTNDTDSRPLWGWKTDSERGGGVRVSLGKTHPKQTLWFSISGKDNMKRERG